MVSHYDPGAPTCGTAGSPAFACLARPMFTRPRVQQQILCGGQRRCLARPSRETSPGSTCTQLAPCLRPACTLAPNLWKPHDHHEASDLDLSRTRLHVFQDVHMSQPSVGTSASLHWLPGSWQSGYVRMTRLRTVKFFSGRAAGFWSSGRHDEH